MFGQTDPSLPFRQQVLQGQFFAMQVGDVAYVEIRKEFEAMYPTDQRFFRGIVESIHEESGTVAVRTSVGLWFFTKTGISRTGQATLSIPSSTYGERLELYEPVST